MSNQIVSKISLKKYFGFDDFRNSLQKHVSREVFKGNRDIYLNLPPGDGKSLCFQLPTVLKSNTVSVVFVPRDILAKDQILFLKQHGINVDYISTRSCKKKLETAIRSFKLKGSEKIQFLYVLVDKKIMDLAKHWIIKLKSQNALSYIVFDEAHCMSSLSHDYVPAYKDAVELVKEICPKICKIVLTATATAEVRREIIHELGMKKIAKFRSPQPHTTVYHDVHFIDIIPEPLEHLLQFIDDVSSQPTDYLTQMHPECGIIFCRKKKTVKEMASKLVSNNIPAVAYHGDLSINDRDSIHEKWINGEIVLIVTTHTFGIGLHKPNVRFVVHWNLPLSFQQMYQESGRVSKDGIKSYCRVYYSYHEEENIKTYLKSLSKKSAECVESTTRKLRFFEDLINYCLEVKCRHVSRWKYFEQLAPACKKFCDVCRDARELNRRVTKCRKYRASMKKAAVDKLTLEVKAVPIKIKPDCTENENEITTSVRPTRMVRYRSLHKLIHELMTYYKQNHKQIEIRDKKFDITEIARRLENSLYNGAQVCSKYNHDVEMAVLNIRKATKSGLACIHFSTQEKQHIFDTEADEIVDLTID